MALSKFWFRNRRPLFVLFLFLAPLVPLFLLKITLPRINFVEKISSWVVHPLSELTLSASGGVSVLWKRYLALVGVQSENEELRKKIGELESQILSLEQLKTENQRLSELLSIPDFIQGPRLGAKIVGQDSSSESISFVINVGSDQGIKFKMPVITNQGIVGSISRVFSGYSTVKTIVDPSHDLDGTIVRTRSRFIVEGKSRGGLTGKLKFLDRADDVRVGDEIVSSGIDGVFPKGLLIGHVISLKKPRHGVTQEAEVRSSVDFGKLEEVLVVLKTPLDKLEQENLGGTLLGPFENKVLGPAEPRKNEASL
jgi:rod shape-determining protein MreC